MILVRAVARFQRRVKTGTWPGLAVCMRPPPFQWGNLGEGGSGLEGYSVVTARTWSSLQPACRSAGTLAWIVCHRRRRSGVLFG